MIVLCPTHKTVYQAAFDILKPGGEMYISEMFSDQTLPEKFDTDMRLLCKFVTSPESCTKYDQFLMIILIYYLYYI